MREYTKTSPRLWQSTRFRALARDDDRYCFAYLLTNEHQNSAGCYRLPSGYAATDLCWPIDKYRERLGALVTGGMIQVDTSTDEVLIERWFDHNPPMNEKHRIGTQRIIARIQSTELRTAADGALERAWNEILERRDAASNRAGTTQRSLLIPIRGQRPS